MMCSILEINRWMVQKSGINRDRGVLSIRKVFGGGDDVVRSLLCVCIILIYLFLQLLVATQFLLFS